MKRKANSKRAVVRKHTKQDINYISSAPDDIIGEIFKFVKSTKPKHIKGIFLVSKRFNALAKKYIDTSHFLYNILVKSNDFDLIKKAILDSEKNQGSVKTDDIVSTYITHVGGITYEKYRLVFDSIYGKADIFTATISTINRTVAFTFNTFNSLKYCIRAYFLSPSFSIFEDVNLHSDRTSMHLALVSTEHLGEIIDKFLPILSTLNYTYVRQFLTQTVLNNDYDRFTKLVQKMMSFPKETIEQSFDDMESALSDVQLVASNSKQRRYIEFAVNKTLDKVTNTAVISENILNACLEPGDLGDALEYILNRPELTVEQFFNLLIIVLDNELRDKQFQVSKILKFDTIKKIFLDNPLFKECENRRTFLECLFVGIELDDLDIIRRLIVHPNFDANEFKWLLIAYSKARGESHNIKFFMGYYRIEDSEEEKALERVNGLVRHIELLELPIDTADFLNTYFAIHDAILGDLTFLK